MMRNLILIPILFFATSNFSQKQLELEEIMRGDEFIGPQPEDVSWAPDNKAFYFRWAHENEYPAPYYEYTIKSQKLVKLSPEEAGKLPVNGFYADESGIFTYFKNGSDLYRYQNGNVSLVYRQTNPYAIEKVFSNGLLVRQDDNLFFIRTSPPFSFIQLTNFKKGSSPEPNNPKNYLERQQDELFEIIRERKKKSGLQSEFSKKFKHQWLKPFYLEKNYLGWISIDDNFEHVIFSVDKYPGSEPTHFASYVNSSGQTEDRTAREKVGAENPEHKLFYWSLLLDTCFEINTEELTGRFTNPGYYTEYGRPATADKAKNVIYHGHGFNKSGSQFLFEVKSYDNKDRWIACYDLNQFRVNEKDHQHDDAWIGGPGIYEWNMVAGSCGWLDESSFYFQSEQSGYSHLYIGSSGSSKPQALTNGKWEVHDAQLLKDKSGFMLTANRNHPGNREIYHLDLQGKLTAIADNQGNHEAFLSPDEKLLVARYSYKNKPWEIYAGTFKANAQLNQVTHSTTPEFESYKWREPEVITFTASDQKEVYARIYTPDDSLKNGAAIIFVHGAGYLQNAHNWWSGYHREYMFNNLLTDRGYTVMDIDYRASKGYGRDYRTAIYRYMGGRDLEDHIDGRQYLIEQHSIDPERIGIYGGSYGGFITIMALLTYPGKFKCGAALRSVTDWAHYNHDYTSNILNTPEEDSIAFRKSSPIYYADQLRDQLLMLHGIEDDNVQYQDVVRLSQRFIELRKKTWDLIGYPVEPHGFKETSSWIDEYRRILDLFETELNEKN